jgi:subtilisin family serine protease
MPAPEERLARYQSRREARLQSLPRLRSVPAGTAARAWYVADELLVLDDERQHVEDYLHANRQELTPLGDEQVVPGLRRYLATGVDVPAAVRAIHRDRPAGAAVTCPNHVFLGTPFNHGGPFGPPVPVAASKLDPRDLACDPTAVAIVDTGVWKESALPDVYLQPGAVEYEEETDVDKDGVLDGDVGHANFIAGVIVRHARQVGLSVIRVLDTFGVCTEAELVRGLGRLDRSAQIVNLSLGGFTVDGAPPVALQAAMELALGVPDRVAIAAAGNNGNRTDPFWPAAFTSTGHSWSDRIAAVAAHDGAQICDWSNAGGWVTLAAPGQDIESTYITHEEFPSGWAQWSGTSFATPRVAAEVAARVAAGARPADALAQVVASASGTYGGYPGIS